MSAKCEAIIELYRAGYTNSEIVKLIKAPRSTIHHTKRFKELGNAADQPRSEDHEVLALQSASKLLKPVSSATHRYP